MSSIGTERFFFVRILTVSTPLSPLIFCHRPFSLSSAAKRRRFAFTQQALRFQPCALFITQWQCTRVSLASLCMFVVVFAVDRCAAAAGSFRHGHEFGSERFRSHSHRVRHRQRGETGCDRTAARGGKAERKQEDQHRDACGALSRQVDSRCPCRHAPLSGALLPTTFVISYSSPIRSRAHLNLPRDFELLAIDREALRSPAAGCRPQALSAALSRDFDSIAYKLNVLKQ